jgi:AcrR family transcriptional regulator
VRSSVLEATADLLIESGLEKVELSNVAYRAGVGKSTVYRRWGTVTALVADLLVDMANTSARRPSTGSLYRDLLAISRLVQRTLADPRQGRLFAAIIAAATCNRETAAALAGFYNARIMEFCGTVLDGITRGEAPPGTDPAEVIRYLSAPLYYRMLTGNGVPDGEDATRATNAAMAAIAAGVFVTPDPDTQAYSKATSSK